MPRRRPVQAREHRVHPTPRRATALRDVDALDGTGAPYRMPWLWFTAPVSAPARPPAHRDTGWLAVVALALAPVVMAPGAYSRFVLPTLAAAAAGVVLAALAKPVGRLPRSLVAVAAAGAIWLTVAALSSQAPAAQLTGRWPRYEGLVALPVYLGAWWAGARLLGLDEAHRRRSAFVTASTCAAGAAAVVAVAETAGLRPLGGLAARPGSLLGNASHQGSFGVLLLGLLLPRAVQRREPVAAAGSVFAAVLVVTSGSRAALLGAGVALCLIVARSDSWRSRAFGVAAFAAVAVGALGAPATRARVTGDDTLAATTVEGRLLLWSASWELLGSSPLTGVGPSGFVDGIVPFQSQQWHGVIGPADPPDSPHNFVVQLLVAGGVALFVLGVVFCILVVRQLRKNAVQSDDGDQRSSVESLGATAAVLGYSVTLLFGFTTAAVTVTACVILGMAVSEALPARARAARRVAAAWCLVGATWTVALAAGIAGDVVVARATEAAAAGETATAQRQFSAAQRWRPWDPDIALLAATAFAGGASVGDMQQAEAAEEWSSRSLARVPASAEARLLRANALGALGRVDQARDLLAVLLEDQPHDVEVLTSAGLLAAADDDLSAALDHFVTVTRIDPGNGDAWFNVAVLADATGDAALGREAIARVTDLERGSPP